MRSACKQHHVAHADGAVTFAVFVAYQHMPFTRPKQLVLHTRLLWLAVAVGQENPKGLGMACSKQARAEGGGLSSAGQSTRGTQIDN